jgi:sulfofructose kinase
MRESLDLFGIGVAVCDVVMAVEELPNEEQVVQATARSVGIGGGVAVAMATAAALGGRVAFADQLGDDPLSETILTSLRSFSVDVSCLQQLPGQQASVATIWVKRANGSRTIVFSPGSTGELKWTSRLADQVAASRILHLNGRHLNACLQAVQVAKQHAVKVSFDGGAHRYRAEVLPVAQASDILIVAEHFATAHWRTTYPQADTLPPDQLVAFLLNEFPAQLVGVTCGSRSSWLAERSGKTWHQPAVEASPVRDTTGCGDTFHGAFLLGLARGLPADQCAELAAHVAAKNAEHMGAFAFPIEETRQCLSRWTIESG